MVSSVTALARHDAVEHEPATGLSAVLRILADLVPSAEPAVAFTSAVRLCVPLLGDAAAVTLTESEGQSYAITWPARHESLPYSLRTDIQIAPTDAHPGYHGEFVLYFHTRPGEQHGLLAQLIVDRTVAAIERERHDALLAQAQERITNLELALTTNREIGIAMGVLMASFKTTSEDAFVMLRQASQRTHRKLRDIAVDVGETGMLNLPDVAIAQPSREPARARRTGSTSATRCLS
jgi:hypothetical protein